MLRPLFALLCLALPAPPLRAEPVVEAASLRFQSFFAPAPGGRVVYTLLGSGFFRSMRSSEAETIVGAWVAAHPHARAVAVGELPTGASNVKLVYVWLADGTDNLNIELVRRGAVPAGTMADPAQRFDALPDTSPMRKTSGSRPQRLVADAVYMRFIEEVAAAEAEAKREKAGIWAERWEETRDLERVR